jgi:DNA-binding PadR family transcriptional regulator
MRQENLVDYEWRESGRPTRKYYSLTARGRSRPDLNQYQTDQRHHQRYGKEAMNKVITISE